MSAWIDRFLSELVDQREEVSKTRHELIGRLLDLARRGSFPVDPDGWLRSLGLRGRPFSSDKGWSLLRALLQPRLEQELRNAARYTQSLDVREVEEWPLDKLVLVFGGDSATGKTWRLASLARLEAAGPGLVVWVQSTGAGEKTLQKAADVLWRHGLDHDGSLPFDAVMRRMLEKRPGEPNPLLTVFVDNVQTPPEARFLAEQAWGEWHARLALTGPPAVAEALQRRLPERVCATSVVTFSTLELKDYLARRARRWEKVAPGLRDTLRLPLLAQLYGDLPEEVADHPTSDSQLYRRYWKRLVDQSTDSGHIADLELLRKLALTLLEPQPAYPWPAAMLDALHVDDEARARLEASGWLKKVGEDGAEVWHDRLLNWAVAQAVAEVCRSQPAKADSCLNTVARLTDPWRFPRPRWLGDVPLDLLWLLALHDDAGAMTQTIASLLKRLERASPRGFLTEQLYEKVVPALGGGLLRAVLARLEADEGSEDKPSPRVFAACLANLALSAPEQVRSLAARLIRSQRPEAQETGLRLLAVSPDDSCREWLWERHVPTARAIKSGDKTYFRRHEYGLTQAALAACTATDIQWLVTKCATWGADPIVLEELACLVVSLPREVGAPVWAELKGRFFGGLPDRSLALARNIVKFNDKDQTPRLLRWLRGDPSPLTVALLEYLAYAAPDLAVGELSAVEPGLVKWAGPAVIPELLAWNGERTLAVLRERLRTAGDVFWNLAMAFRGSELELDVATSELLLDHLQRELRQPERNLLSFAQRLVGPLELVSSMRAPQALAAFKRRVGSELEQRLADLACQVIREANDNYPRFVDPTLTVLLFIGGTGLTQVVNAVLARPGWKGTDWHLWATAQPDAETRARLSRIARSGDLEEGSGRNVAHEQALAIQALAAIGEDDEVIQGLMRWGEHVISDGLIEIRKRRPPISMETLAIALVALESPDVTRKANALLTIGVSGQKQLSERLRQIVRSPGHAVPVTKAALQALAWLGEEDGRITLELTSHLDHAETRAAAVQLLVTIGTPAATGVLARALMESGGTSLPAGPWNVVGYLLCQSEQRRRVLEYLWEKTNDRDEFWQLLGLGEGQSFADLADLGTREVEEFLWESAFPPRSGIHVVGQTATAVRGLAKFNPAEAFSVAETLLAEASTDRDVLPKLLIDLDAVKGIPVVCRQAHLETSALVLWKAGLALRLSGQPDLVRSQIFAMLTSANCRIQRAGAVLAGWQGSGFLSEHLTRLRGESPDADVRAAAWEATRQQKNENIARELIASLQAARGIDQWRYAEAAATVGHPFLLCAEGDPLGIGSLADLLPFPVASHVDNRLQGAIQNVSRKADDLDRRRE